MRKRKFFMWSLSLMLVAAAVFSATFGTAKTKLEAEQAAQSPFAAEYAVDDVVSIPSHDVTVNGVPTASVPVVLMPDGNAVSAESVKVGAAGVYTVEYRATVDGIVYKDVYSFTVKKSLFSTAAKSDNVAYETVTLNGSSAEGLHVSLASGSTFTCNQAIDLNKLTKDDELISLYVVPEAYNIRDCEYLYIQLTDAVDPTNYISICLRQSPYGSDVVYAMAKASNQPSYKGVEQGDFGGNPTFDGYGFAAAASFYGVGFGNDKFRMSLSFDNATSQLYMQNNVYGTGGTFVVDFTDPLYFAEAWKGFTNGKVFVSLYATRYEKTSMSFLLTSLSQVDLEESVLEVTEPSGLDIDYGDYTSANYPHAVVGHPYRVFDAAPYSIYTAEQVYATVKTSYGSSNAIDVDIKDGCFTPSKSVTHTIVYRCTDGFGNSKEYAVPVTVDESFAEIDFTLDQTPISTSVGAYIVLPSVTEAHGGNGVLKTAVSLTNTATGDSITLSDRTYRFVQSGSYKLKYTVYDYNMCKAEKEIDVTVAPASAPIFAEDPVFAKRYIKGAKYAVPELFAEDFSSGSMQKTAAAVKVYGDQSELAVTDGYFNAYANSTVRFVYTATDGQGRTATKEYSAKVVDVGFADNIDITKYFLTKGGSITANDRSLTVKGTGSTATFEFINAIGGKTFSAAFALESGKTGYSGLEFRLTDSEDPVKTVSVQLANSEGKTAVSVNGGKPVPTDFKFGGDIRDFAFELNGAQLYICDQYMDVKTYEDGTPFAGFDKLIYFTIVMKGCSGDAEMQLKNINRQGMSARVTRDTTEPMIMFLGGRNRGERELNATVTIDPVVTSDVLDPYSTITLSVRLPSREYAKTSDGTELRNVSADKTYSFTIDGYGSYALTYTYSDSSDNQSTFTSIISCIDKEPPTVVVSVEETTGKVGEAVVIPEYTVTDNVCGEDDIVVLIQIITPEGIYIDYNENTGYVFETVGTYTIRYYTFDNQFNARKTDIVCKVSR